MLEYCLKIFLENYTLWEKKVLKKYPLDLSTNSFTLASKYNILYRKKGDIDCVTKKRFFLYPKNFILGLI